ncbi:MAG: flagellar basal body protein [Mycobacteriales bacterium]
MTGVEGVLHSALRGLSLRQRTIADNIANIETPNFLAGKVDFESSLRAAAANGEAPSAPHVARSLEPTRLNGNNVNLDTETVAAMETGLRYELTVTALNNKFNGLRRAIGSA